MHGAIKEVPFRCNLLNVSPLGVNQCGQLGKHDGTACKRVVVLSSSTSFFGLSEQTRQHFFTRSPNLRLV